MIFCAGICTPPPIIYVLALLYGFVPVSSVMAMSLHFRKRSSAV
jgi:hypothetical protein